MSVVITEYPLSRRECFRATVSDHSGVLIITVGRWKTFADGTSRRAGPALEFAAHRAAGIAKLLEDVQRLIEQHENQVHVALANVERRRTTA